MSHNGRVSMKKLVVQNERRFAHIDAPLNATNKLP